MIGEQYDIAVAFANGVLLGQKQGKKHRKVISVEKFKELLQIEVVSPLPDKIREAFTDYNVYTRKLRGKEYVAVWWDEKDSYHGRGVPKNATM